MTENYPESQVNALANVLHLIEAGTDPDKVRQAFLDREQVEATGGAVETYTVRPTSSDIILHAKRLAFLPERSSWRYDGTSKEITTARPFRAEIWSRHIGGLAGITFRDVAWGHPRRNPAAEVWELSVRAEELGQLGVSVSTSGEPSIVRFAGGGPAVGDQEATVGS